MKLPVLLLTVFFLCTCTPAKAQTWQWAQVESQCQGRNTSVAVDASGNSYVASASNGNGALGPLTFTSSAAKCILTKYNALGQILWQVPFYMLANSQGPNMSSIPNLPVVKCDLSGNIIMACGFFGGIFMPSQNFLTTANQSYFIAKFDPNGNLLWIKYGDGTITVADIAIDGNNDILFVGSGPEPVLTLDTYTTSFNINAQYEMFWGKLSSNGNLQWLNCSTSGVGARHAKKVCVLPNNDFVIGGNFTTNLLLNAQMWQGNTSMNYFVAKFNSSGNVQWVNTQGGATSNELLYSLAVDVNNNIYVGGEHSGTCSIGSTTNAAIGFGSSFTAMHNSSGQVQWVHYLNTPFTSANCAMLPHNNGVLAMLSVREYVVTLGASTFTLPNNSDGALLVDFSNGGTVNNVTPIAAGGYDSPNMQYAGNCQLVVAGCLQTPSVVLGNATLTHTNSYAPLFSKLSIPNATAVISLSGPQFFCIGSTFPVTASGATSYTWSNGFTGSSLLLTPSGSQTLSVVGKTQPYGCLSTASIVLQSLPGPTIAIAASTTLVCSGQTVSLSASGAQNYQWNTGSSGSTAVVAPLNSTVISVTGSSANCSSTQTVLIQIKASPVLQIITTPSSVCLGAAVQIAVSGANTYTWSNGSNSQSYLVAAANTTVLSVSGTNTLTGCTSTLTSMLNVSNCTGIESEDIEGKIMAVYPNPTDCRITLVSNQSICVELLNTLGSILKSINLIAGETATLDVSDLPAGCYVLRDVASGQSQKMMVQR